MPVAGVPMSPFPPLISPFIGGIVPGNSLPIVPATDRSSITFEKHGNLGYSTVATAPSPATTGTSMVLGSDSSTFPSPTAPGALPYSVTVWPTASQMTQANSEIVTFQAIDPGTLTVTMLRAQEGSTARTIVAGDQVSLTHSLKAQADVENAVLGLDSRTALLEQMTVAAQPLLYSLPVVSELPIGPVNGQEIILRAGFGDDAVYWRLKYDASITDSHKWRFIGGPPLHNQTPTWSTDVTTSSGTFVDLAPIVYVVAPCPGIYFGAHGCANTYGDSGTAYPNIGLMYGAQTPTDDIGNAFHSSGATVQIPLTMDFRFDFTTALFATSPIIKQQYSSRVSTAVHFTRRWMTVWPVRLG